MKALIVVCDSSSTGLSRILAISDELSGGTLAKLNLGLALLPDPDLLLLDGPSTGFDWDIYQKFWGLVAQRRAPGRTVLIVSHFVIDDDRFDRTVAIRDGKAVAG